MTQIAKKLSKWTQQEIKQFFATAKAAIKIKELTILVSSSPLSTTQSFHKLLITTPRKIGSAPQRNKLRRQLKSIFYQEKLYAQGKHIAVLLRSGAPEISFEQLKSMLIQTLQKTVS
jgi:ribonuclease P protein component